MPGDALQAPYDAWTRRRFGLAAAGAVASIVGLIGLGNALAKMGKKD